MFKILFAAIMVLLLAGNVYSNPVCDVGEEQAREDVREYLKERHNLNYAVRSLLSHNMKKFDKICRIPEDENSEQILEDLMDYYPDFSYIYSRYESTIASLEDGQYEPGSNKKENQEESRREPYVPVWYH